MIKKTLVLLVFCFCYLSFYAQNNIEELFNGKDLTNWNFIVDQNKAPAEKVYSVKDGFIYIKGQPFGYMYTKNKYRNYHLHVEWRWDGEASNSGIFLQIAETKDGNPFPNGIECQLQAGNAGDFVLLGGSDLKEYQLPADRKRPAFPIIKKANASSEKPIGEWNCADIYVYNGIITVYINGVFQNSATNFVKEGHIGLQSEGKDILFRNVRLAEIK